MSWLMDFIKESNELSLYIAKKMEKWRLYLYVYPEHSHEKSGL